MRDIGWYGRKYDLDPGAMQLRLHIDVAHARRPVHARLFQVPSAGQRRDSPLWQYVSGWAVDPEEVGRLRNIDDALGRLIVPCLALRLPGIDQ